MERQESLLNSLWLVCAEQRLPAGPRLSGRLAGWCFMTAKEHGELGAISDLLHTLDERTTLVNMMERICG